MSMSDQELFDFYSNMTNPTIDLTSKEYKMQPEGLARVGKLMAKGATLGYLGKGVESESIGDVAAEFVGSILPTAVIGGGVGSLMQAGKLGSQLAKLGPVASRYAGAGGAGAVYGGAKEAISGEAPTLSSIAEKALEESMWWLAGETVPVLYSMRNPKPRTAKQIFEEVKPGKDVSVSEMADNIITPGVQELTAEQAVAKLRDYHIRMNEDAGIINDVTKILGRTPSNGEVNMLKPYMKEMREINAKYYTDVTPQPTGAESGFSPEQLTQRALDLRPSRFTVEIRPADTYQQISPEGEILSQQFAFNYKPRIYDQVQRRYVTLEEVTRIATEADKPLKYPSQQRLKLDKSQDDYFREVEELKARHPEAGAILGIDKKPNLSFDPKLMGELKAKFEQDIESVNTRYPRGYVDAAAVRQQLLNELDKKYPLFKRYETTTGGTIIESVDQNVDNAIRRVAEGPPRITGMPLSPKQVDDIKPKLDEIVTGIKAKTPESTTTTKLYPEAKPGSIEEMMNATVTTPGKMIAIEPSPGDIAIREFAATNGMSLGEVKTLIAKSNKATEHMMDDAAKTAERQRIIAEELRKRCL